MSEISEKIVIQSFQKSLETDGIEFLKGRDSEKKNLLELLDELAETDDHHQKLITGKKIWKILFEHAMSYIDPDRRGYDNLFAMLDDYVEFEELMFASDPFYRDHTLHSLWVYFLGEYLCMDPQFSKIFTGLEMSFYPDQLRKKAMDLIECSIPYEDRFEPSIRCVAALSHDLGYPIKKVDKINRALGKILPHFSITHHQEFSFAYLPLQQGYLNELARIISSDIRANPSSQEDFLAFCQEQGIEDPFSREGIEIMEQLPRKTRKKMGEAYNPVFQIKTNRLGFLGMLKEVEAYQHGFMSVYLLTKLLPAFTSATHLFYDSPEPQFLDQPSSLFSKLMIMAAIVAHSSSLYTIRNIDSPQAFLTFVDELEEFSRISRADHKRKFVEQFCRTELDLKGKWFEIKFIFAEGDPAHLNPEIFFRDKVKRFLQVFAINDLGENFWIRLIVEDRLTGKENPYYTLEVARKHVKLSVGGKEVLPCQYLGKSEFKFNFQNS